MIAIKYFWSAVLCPGTLMIRTLRCCHYETPVCTEEPSHWWSCCCCGGVEPRLHVLKVSLAGHCGHQAPGGHGQLQDSITIHPSQSAELSPGQQHESSTLASIKIKLIGTRNIAKYQVHDLRASSLCWQCTAMIAAVRKKCVDRWQYVTAACSGCCSAAVWPLAIAQLSQLPRICSHAIIDTHHYHYHWHLWTHHSYYCHH